MIEFRAYEENDYADLKDMILSLYREDPEGEPIDEEKIRRTIAESRKYPEKLSIFMFCHKNENVGYAILVYFWSNEYGGNIVAIDELYVKERYRSRGFGTEFISFAVKMDGAAALQLETTPSNLRALEYYKRLGFVPSVNTHLMLIK
jgi:ribosomal protein S18 acetylase RimI-like enzyme